MNVLYLNSHMRHWYQQVIPQALNSRYGLRFGATMSPFVRVLLLLFFPVAYPISKVINIFSIILILGFGCEFWGE
jgi:CBS domain containing-hemolysin-like protein